MLMKKNIDADKVYIVRIGKDNGDKSRYIYTKRVCVHFPEYASKYSCWESAYHCYKNSDFCKNGEEATYVIYNKRTGELIPIKKRNRSKNKQPVTTNND